VGERLVDGTIQQTVVSKKSAGGINVR
jgi:hypothetical protein